MYNFFKTIIKYIIIKIKFGKKLQFGLSNNISIKSTFEGANKLYPDTTFSGSMGYGSYIGNNSEVYADIGRFTSIANYVRTNLGFHPIGSPFATTSPMFFSTNKQNGETFATLQMFNELKRPAIIGNDVWIGENVFFVGGVNIGDGSVVLAGAVVTKDVPPYAIVGGVPAKVLSYRYDEETIQFLMELKWWNFEIEWLRLNWELFCNIDRLKNYFRRKPGKLYTVIHE